ncbi:DUF4232 domain-containing protein [Actinopolyspora sp. H202]|uniref:DUF4232 domain-containing protein n=1 Tax=Actinopolyspora sp. H202 TaxID=1500456 RepID=UPI003EE80965
MRSASDGRASSPSSTPTNSSASDCPETGVRLTTDLVEVAMGLRLMHVELANCGDQPYTLDGYPRVRVLDEERRPLDVRAEQGSADIATVDGFDKPPEAITVRPGEHAEAQLMWRNTHASMNAPQVGKYLRIAPARGRAWQSVIPVGRERNSSGQDRDEITINLGSTGKLGVRAWYR